MPIPADVSAALRLAAEAYQQMRAAGDDERQDELLGDMIAELVRLVEEGSMRRVEGVGDEFLDGESYTSP